VTDTVVRDTHIALWLDSGDLRLRAPTRALIVGCWQSGGTILFSAISRHRRLRCSLTIIGLNSTFPSIILNTATRQIGS
jgi:PIN domain nuclease of toxin-antitoxin system